MSTPAWSLSSSSHVSVDLEDLLTQATAALDAHRAQAPGATAQLEAAVTAHTGDLFEDEPY